MQNTTTQPVQSAPHTPAPYPFTETDVSDIADAMNFLLSALHCPRSVRPLMHALMGFLAGRKTKASFYHFDLARRMDKLEYIENADEFKRYKDAAVSRVRAAIDKMKKWNDEWDGLNIDYTPGGRKQNGELFPSAIQTPLLSWVSDVANEVRAKEGFTRMTERKRAEAFRKTIGEMLEKKRVLRREKAVKRCKKEMSYDQILKMTATMGSKYLAKLQEEGREPTPELINGIAIYLADIWKNEFVGVGYELHHHPDAEETPATEDLQDYSKEPVVSENLASQTEMGAAGGAPRSSLPSSDSLKAVELFASVGVTEFGETTMIEDRPDYQVLSLDTMRLEVDDRIVAAESWSSSYIVRPVVSSDSAVKLIHLDDFNQDCRSEIKTMAFIGFKTSLEKEQAYIAVRMPDPADNAERLRVRRALIKHFGADPSATAASRFPGSNNRKYTPAYPVTVTIENLGRIIDYSEIEHLLPALPAPVKPRSYKPSSRRPFPDWTIEESRRPTRVNADWWWTLKALDRERGIEETIDELLRVSTKAKEKGRAYAADTVRNAAAAMGIV